MARIAGVKKVYIAKIKTSASTLAETVYEAPVELKQFISFSGSENKAESSWYSNDNVEETFAQITDYDLEIQLGDLSLENRALITGAKLSADKSRIVSSSDDVQPEFAVIVQLSQLGSGKTGTLNQVYYRAKLTANSTEGETKTDSITDSPISVTGKAIPLASGEIMAQADSYDTASASAIASWFTKPHGSKAEVKSV